MSRFKTSVVFKQKFTKEMLLELEETFAMVCNEEGTMPTEKLSLALQALGLDVSESYYEDLVDTKTTTIDFDVFLAVVNTCMDHANFMLAGLICYLKANCYSRSLFPRKYRLNNSFKSTLLSFALKNRIARIVLHF